MPLAAPTAADSVSVVLHPGEQLPEENDAVTPLGRADAVNDVGPGTPAIRLALIVVLPLDPRTTDTVDGEADRENCAATASVLKLEPGETVRAPVEL